MYANLVTHRFFVFSVFVALLVCFTGGSQYGWSSPIVPKLQEEDSKIPITDSDVSWLGSVAFLASTTSVPFCYLCIGWLSRRASLTIAMVALTAAYSTCIVAEYLGSLALLFTARVLGGIGLGMGFAFAPVYLGEISPKSIRGAILFQVTVMQNVGTLWIYLIGSYTPIWASSAGTIVFCLVFFTCIKFIPESPYYLLRQGRKAEARDAMILLRGRREVLDEVHAIIDAMEAEDKEKKSPLDLFTVRANLSALGITAIAVVANMWGGGSTLIVFAHLIFRDSGSNLSPTASALIVASVDLVAISLVSTVIEKAGKRPVILVSIMGSFICLMILSTYLYFFQNDYDVSAFTWVPLASLISFVIINSGLKGMMFTMLGEIFANNVKALGVAMSKVLITLGGFSATQFYNGLATNIGNYVPFYTFSAVLLVCFVLSFFYFPETTGRTLEEIQQDLKTPNEPTEEKNASTVEKA